MKKLFGAVVMLALSSSAYSAVKTGLGVSAYVPSSCQVISQGVKAWDVRCSQYVSYSVQVARSKTEAETVIVTY